MEGVTGREADDGPVPSALVAETEQLYGVPLVSPFTEIGDALPVAEVAPQVAVYSVIGDPPVVVGAVKDTTARASPGVADTIVGAPGTRPVMPNICVTLAAGK